MEMPQCSLIDLEIQNKILTLSVNNGRNNYMPTQFFIELEACLPVMCSDQVDAVIVTGKGNVFSKGADIEEIKSGSGKVDFDSIMFGNRVFSKIASLEKPIIAAINGACFGGGLELALSCHLRVCSEKARMGLPELTAGVIPGLGGIQRLARVVGEAKAIELVMTGDMINAKTAQDIHLVSRVFEKKVFQKKTQEFIRMLLTTRKAAIIEFLRNINELRDKQDEVRIKGSAESFMRLINSMDFA